MVELPHVVGQSADVAAAGEPLPVHAFEIADVSAESLRAAGEGVHDGRARSLFQFVGKVPLGRHRRLEGLEVAQGVHHPFQRASGGLGHGGNRQYQ